MAKNGHWQMEELMVLRTVDHLKNICIHYGMNKRGKKNELINVIFVTFEAINALERHEELSTSITNDFRVDSNTIPRLCNIVLQYHPSTLLQTGAIASRVDLQNRDVGATHSLWQDVADSINNPDYEVGLIIKSHTHTEFQKKNVNPSINQQRFNSTVVTTNYVWYYTQNL
jgi:hypothetical protein